MYSGEADEVATKRIEPASDGGTGGVQADRVLHLSPTKPPTAMGKNRYLSEWTRRQLGGGKTSRVKGLMTVQ